MGEMHVLRRKDEDGFSMIELFVVILVIAVLAAVATMFFLNQRNRSYESQVQASLKNAVTAMESYATKNEGDYPNTDTTEPLADLVGEGYRKTSGVVLTIEDGDKGNYCLEANHDSMTVDWHYQGNVGKAQTGGC